MAFYLGAFLVVALDWRAQARNATLNTHALQALEARVAVLEEAKEALGRQNEACQASLKLAQEAKEEAERQLDEAMEFQADFYVREVSLQVQITDLQDMAEASEELQKDLEDQCYGQAKKLEWMEEEMATQAKTLDLLQVDHDKIANRGQPASSGEGGSGEPGGFRGLYHRGVGEGQEGAHR